MLDFGPTGQNLTSPNNVVVASFSTIAIGPYYPQLVPNILRPFGPYDLQSVPTILRPLGPYDPQLVPTIFRPFDSTIRNRSLHFVFFSFFYFFRTMGVFQYARLG